jgi:hypothetical protein
MSSEIILKEARALSFDEQIELCRKLWNEILHSHELAPGEARREMMVFFCVEPVAN